MSKLSMVNGRIVIDGDDASKTNAAAKENAHPFSALREISEARSSKPQLSMVNGKIVMNGDRQAAQPTVPQRRSSNNVMEMAINSLKNRVANSATTEELKQARREQFDIDNAQLIDQASSKYDGPWRTSVPVSVRSKNTLGINDSGLEDEYVGF